MPDCPLTSRGRGVLPTFDLGVGGFRPPCVAARPPPELTGALFLPRKGLLSRRLPSGRLKSQSKKVGLAVVAEADWGE